MTILPLSFLDDIAYVFRTHSNFWASHPLAPVQDWSQPRIQRTEYTVAVRHIASIHHASTEDQEIVSAYVEAPRRAYGRRPTVVKEYSGPRLRFEYDMLFG